MIGRDILIDNSEIYMFERVFKVNNQVVKSACEFGHGEKAQKFFSQGYRFTIRPMVLKNKKDRVIGKDLLANEANATDKNEKRELVAIQKMRINGWRPSAKLGTDHGKYAIEHAQASGFVEGRSILCELDASYLKVKPESVLAYCQAWSKTVNLAGYQAGLYDGTQLLPLSSETKTDAAES